MRNPFSDRGRWHRRLRSLVSLSLRRKVRLAILVTGITLVPIVILGASHMAQLLVLTEEFKKDTEIVGATGSQIAAISARIRNDEGWLKPDSTLPEGWESWGQPGIERVFAQALEEEGAMKRCEDLENLVNFLLPQQMQPEFDCYRTQHREDYMALLERVHQEALHRMADSEAKTVALADDAIRIQLSLGFLALLVFGWAVVQFPRTLFRDLRRLAGIIHQAEGGRTDVVAPEFGLEELDELSRSFNSMQATLREFEAKKRNRIVTDRGRIEVLISQLKSPVAILDRSMNIEIVNDAMKTVLPISQGATRTPLMRLIEQGAGGNDMFVAFLNDASHSRGNSSCRLEIDRNGSRTNLTAQIVPVCGGDGEVDSFILLFTIEEEASG